MKKKMLKYISLLLVAILLCAFAPATTAAGQITTALDFSSGGDQSGDGYEWSSGTSTLTLTGLTLETDAAIALKLPGNATIVLADGSTNTIISTNGETAAASRGIDVAGDLTIKGETEGTGTLEITAGAASSTSYGLAVEFGKLTVQSGTINGTGGVSSDSRGVSVLRSGALLEVTGGVLNGIANGQNGANMSAGVYVLGPITISEKGFVSGKSKGGATYKFGFYSNSTTEPTFGSKKTFQEVDGQEADVTWSVTGEGGSRYSYHIDGNASEPSPHVELYGEDYETGGDPDPELTDYTLYYDGDGNFYKATVEDSAVTKGEVVTLPNISASGSEITMNGFVFETTAGTAMLLRGGVTLNMDGINTITSTYSDDYGTLSGIEIRGGALSFEGDGELTVTAGDSTYGNSNGFYDYSGSGISVNGGTVTAIGGTASSSRGINVVGITVNDTGTLIAKGNTLAIYDDTEPNATAKGSATIDGAADQDLVWSTDRYCIQGTTTPALHVVLTPATGEDPDPGDDPGDEPVTPPPYNPPVKPTLPGNDGNVRVDYSEDDGEVALELPDSKIDELIDSAEDGTVTIDISGVKDANSAAFDVSAAESFADAEVAVTIVLPAAEITLDLDALSAIADTTDIGSTPVTVEAATVPTSELSGKQAAQVKGYEPIVSIDVFVGDEKVDVPVTVSLPYKLKANEDPNAVRVWYLGDDGKLTRLSGVYNEKTGMITFTVTHQSYFVVGYDPVALWQNIFTDIAPGDWFYDAVAYANYYGYANGNENRFKPLDTFSRATFVTLIWKLEGNPTNGAPGASHPTFSDVPDGLWYTDAVYWAAENDIVQGDGNGFTPSKLISRQEMITMLHNYLQYKGYSIPAYQETTYEDGGDIASWASDAVIKLANAGVLDGFIEEALNPEQNAIRAELAQLFMDFLRLVA